jgi:hypothetical protein
MSSKGAAQMGTYDDRDLGDPLSAHQRAGPGNGDWWSGLL